MLRVVGWSVLVSTYVGNVGALVLGELLVVAQEQDGVLQGEGVVKVALGLPLRRALHLTDRQTHALNKHITKDYHEGQRKKTQL